MRTDELDFHLPPELIAQSPAAERSDARLLHYRRGDESITHRRFRELPGLLRPGDLLVFNDTRVIPARFLLRKPTGGLVEGLFLEQPAAGQWRVMLRNLGRAGRGLTFALDPSLQVEVLEAEGEGIYRIAVAGREGGSESADTVLQRLGRMPLPPYIRREKQRDPRDELDRERYQTVFARSAGSVAAPTAALHFTPQLLDRLTESGIERCFVTLDVGLGTFKPVQAGRMEEHTMHVERYRIPPGTAQAINRAEQQGRRIITVGTTSARVLESQAGDRPVQPHHGQTDIFIYPPYSWKRVAGLITNFHLPRSTLIALVAAMTGLEQQRRIYAEAIEHRYRFFSYGDAMFIE